MQDIIALAATNSPGSGAASTGASFRFSAAGGTGAGDTNWQTVTSNGVTQTVKNSGIAVSAGTSYRLRIDFVNYVSVSSGTILFYVNDVLAGTHTCSIDNCPAAATSMLYQARVTPLTGTAKEIDLSKVTVFGQITP